jgi:hypothetical protein
MEMVEANCDWNQIDGLNNGEANVSSGLCPQFRGHGLATRALALLHGFLGRTQIERSVIRVEPENQASLFVPRCLGHREARSVTTEDGATLLMSKKDLRKKIRQLGQLPVGQCAASQRKTWLSFTQVMNSMRMIAMTFWLSARNSGSRSLPNTPRRIRRPSVTGCATPFGRDRILANAFARTHGTRDERSSASVFLIFHSTRDSRAVWVSRSRRSGCCRFALR